MSSSEKRKREHGDGGKHTNLFMVFLEEVKFLFQAVQISPQRGDDLLVIGLGLFQGNTVSLHRLTHHHFSLPSSSLERPAASYITVNFYSLPPQINCFPPPLVFTAVETAYTGYEITCLQEKVLFCCFVFSQLKLNICICVAVLLLVTSLCIIFISQSSKKCLCSQEVLQK